MAAPGDVQQLIDGNAEWDVGQPASGELIERAERFLGVRFPEDYREFLKRWGTLSLAPLEIYGITGQAFENAGIPDAVGYTARKRREVGLPAELICLYNNDGVEYYCLDTSDVNRSRVVAWSVSDRRVESVKAESLFDFIINEAADLV